MKFRIVVLALALFINSCASTSTDSTFEPVEYPTPTPKDPDKPAVIYSERDTLAAIVEILDSAYYDWAFPNRGQGLGEEEFYKRIEKFKKAMPGRLNGLTWEVAMVRYEYARIICDSSIALPRGVRDRRFDEILRKGIPTGEWTLPGEVTRGGKILEVTFYCLSWNATDAVILESRYRGGRPVRRSPPNRKIPTAEMTIDLVTNYTYSKETDGSYAVTFAIWARLSSINLETFNRGSLDFAVTLVNSKGQAATRTRIVPLAVYLRMAEVATNPGEHFVRGYVNFFNLPRGNYLASVDVQGSENNFSRETMPVDVPSPKVSPNLGEPTILNTNVPKGDILGQPGAEGDIVYSNPFTQFTKGTELQIYQPVNLNPGTYRLRALMIPLPAYTPSQNPRVELGRSYTDSLEGEEYPIPVNQWTGRTPDSLLREFQKPTPKDDVSYNFEAVCQVPGPSAFAIFTISLRELRLGRYTLIIIMTTETEQSAGKAEMRLPIEVIASSI